MKAKNLLLIAIVSILSISCANSKKVVYANEVEKLNTTHQSLLEHTKNTYTTSDTKILLPIELNLLLGDSASAQKIEAHPQWENAYFVKDREEDVLVVPMQSNHKDMELFSDLIVIKKDSIYPKMVSTFLKCETEKKTKYVHIESNIDGKICSVLECDKDGKLIRRNEIRDPETQGTKLSSVWSSRYRSRKAGDNIPYRNDWRNANNKGYHIDYQGNKVLNKKDY